MAGKWHLMTPEEVLEVFRSDPVRGLEEKEASDRLARFGPNEIGKEPVLRAGQIFVEQFRDIKLSALLAVAALTGLTGEYAGAAAVLVMALLGAVTGFIQEYRTEKNIRRAKDAIVPRARVVRDGKEKTVPAKLIVPGDLVILEQGDIVPADLRLTWTSSLQIEEAVLTGDTGPVIKSEPEESGEDSPGHRRNMAFGGTVVSGGSGRGVVVATGMLSEIGLEAGVSGHSEDDAPMQGFLAYRGRFIFYAGLAACLAVTVIGVYRGQDVYLMLLTGLSLAAAAVPGGLPAVLNFSLGLGLIRMLRRGVVAREISAVEKTAGVTVLCLNKTGILTRNVMTVRLVLAGDAEVTAEGEGYEPRGALKYDRGLIKGPELQLLLRAAALCNNAVLHRGEITIGGLFRDMGKGLSPRQWGISGDPTEGALLVMAARGGVWREKLEQKESRVREIPFSPGRRRMTVIYRGNTGNVTAYVKGAPEELLDRCASLYQDGVPVPMGLEDREKLLRQVSGLAARGLRVLALACREMTEDIKVYEPEAVERELVFLGLAGLGDTPDPAAAGVLYGLRRAGVKAVLATGEHPLTARALAAEAGFWGLTNSVITGEQMDQMNDGELARELEKGSIFARVDPFRKLRIIKSLKQSGHVVACTGKGVADIPVINEADLGIALEGRAAPALIDKSSLVLRGGGFSSFAGALEESRGICRNARNILIYLLSCCLSLLAVTLAAVLAGFPPLFLPVQILWLGLLFGGLPVMALGMDPPDKRVLFNMPEKTSGILNMAVARKVASRGIVAGLAVMSVFCLLYGGSPGGLDAARTAALNAMVLMMLFCTFTGHNEYHAGGEFFPPANQRLTAAAVSILALQLAVTYLSLLTPLFHTVPLQLHQWGLILAVCALALPAVLVFRRIRKRFGEKIMYLKV
ncbi:cation-transporting ATPase [Desulfocucumis palustris]|uniref:Cation-transporting ATPase n=1 Tax=Desulfocucumis palustris TaxID=1898651 RepID=A0A2L2XE90_9FIRM|nr:cation-transporting P-type ATPase [Desulfocucumis palustris]GBF32556.1 cation-transporting ATPase [Desulfocucumis palustris]